MKRRRGPLQTLIVAGAVVAGIIAGTRLIAAQMRPEADRRVQASRPDVTIRDARPEDLVAHGFQPGPRTPRTWSGISLRRFEDERGTMTMVRCTIAPEEAGLLVDFPPDSRRTLDDQPPADWAQGAAGDPFLPPDWFAGPAARSRCYDAVPPDGPARGIYAGYDPATRLLRVWTWVRTDVRLVRPNADRLLADELAMALANVAVQGGVASSPQGWLAMDRLDPRQAGQAAERMPAGTESVAFALLPLRGRHRYLLRIDGIDEAAARALAAGTPLRALPDDAAPPATPWKPMLPEGGALPAWFAPGPGPRGVHCLVRLADGGVERGRWFAYDPVMRRAFLWDWEQAAAPLLPAADLTGAQ